MPLWRAKSKETEVAEATVDERVNEVDNAPQNNLSLVTLLATDYLNHINEIVMLVDLVPDAPECLVGNPSHRDGPVSPQSSWPALRAMWFFPAGKEKAPGPAEG